MNLSDLIFRLLGYPIIRVRKRTGDDDSPMVRLSFRDLLKFCYLEQEVLDSSFFRLSQPILAEKSKDALNFFAGYYSERLSTLQAEFDQARSEQRAKTEAAERIREFLAQFGFASDSQIDGEIQKNHVRMADVRATLAAGATAFFSQTHFVDEQRARLRKMSDQLNAENQTLEDLDRRLKDQKELRAELMSMKFKVARADRARSVLAGSSFDNCPQCGQSVADLLSRFVTIGDRLPLGLATSPVISNAVFLPIDFELQALANSHGARYSRYADDCTFSSDQRTFDVDLVERCVTRHGFQLAHSKTRRSKIGQAHYVTGLSVSDGEGPHAPRRMKAQLRQELYYAEKFGLHGHLERRLGAHDRTAIQREINRLDGTVKFVAYHEDAKKDSLRKQWRRLLGEGGHGVA